MGAVSVWGLPIQDILFEMRLSGSWSSQTAVYLLILGTTSSLAFDFGLIFGQDETPSEDPWYQSLLGEFYQSIPENRQQPAIDFAGKNGILAMLTFGSLAVSGLAANHMNKMGSQLDDLERSLQSKASSDVFEQVSNDIINQFGIDGSDVRLKLARSNDEISRITESYLKLQKMLDDLKSGRQGRSLTDSISQITTGLSTLITAVTDLKDKITAVENDIQLSEANHVSIDDQIKAIIPDVTAIEADVNIDEVDPTNGNHCRTNTRLSVLEAALNMVTEPNEVNDRLSDLENAVAGGTTGTDKVLNYDVTTPGNDIKNRLSTDNTQISTIASDIGLIFGATDCIQVGMTYKMPSAIPLDTKTNVAMVRGCYEFCHANTDCASFEHVTTSNTCYLYTLLNTASIASAAADTNSGTKTLCTASEPRATVSYSLTREQNVVDAIELDIALPANPTALHEKITDRIAKFESTNVDNPITPIKTDIDFMDHSIPLCTTGTPGSCRTPINTKVTNTETDVSTIATDIGMTFDPTTNGAIAGHESVDSRLNAFPSQLTAIRTDIAYDDTDTITVDSRLESLETFQTGFTSGFSSIADNLNDDASNLGSNSGGRISFELENLQNFFKNKKDASMIGYEKKVAMLEKQDWQMSYALMGLIQQSSCTLDMTNELGELTLKGPINAQKASNFTPNQCQKHIKF